jgi:alkyl hydroperoxide reductase subunit AhpF
VNFSLLKVWSGPFSSIISMVWHAQSAEHEALLNSDREAMPYDVVVVGAGPAGLATAIKVKQMGIEHGTEYSVCVLEK